MTTATRDSAPPVITPWVSPRDLAEQLNVSRETVLMWIRQGKLPKPVKIGRSTFRWSPTTIADFLARQDA